MRKQGFGPGSPGTLVKGRAGVRIDSERRGVRMDLERRETSLRRSAALGVPLLLAFAEEPLRGRQTECSGGVEGGEDRKGTKPHVTPFQAWVCRGCGPVALLWWDE
jgi:hypothetical protein